MRFGKLSRQEMGHQLQAGNLGQSINNAQNSGWLLMKNSAEQLASGLEFLHPVPKKSPTLNGYLRNLTN